MCTALNLKTNDRYFGRNLDLDRSYGEEVAIMPRKFPIFLRCGGELREHFALIGMATFVGGTPLFYEAANEYGLGMAGLNFPRNAHYFSPEEGKDNITQFELIPWILGQCKTLSDVKELLLRINIVDIPFSEQLPVNPLHWMISDGEGSLIVESMRGGLHICENSVGVLTNNPPFPYQLENLEKYSHLRADNALVDKEDKLPYSAYCQGLGAVGLPGDVSSMSRFVRIAYGRENSVCGEGEAESVGQFFHLLTSVEMVRGACITDEGHFDITGYSACINLDRGIYYYTTYGNRRISKIDMHKANLDASEAFRFPLAAEESFFEQN